MLIGDDNHHTDTSHINFFIIGISIAIMCFGFINPAWHNYIIDHWGFIVASHPDDYISLRHSFVTSVTSLFIHADWGHVLVNSFFLYVFGDNIEYAMGKWRYLLFFVLSSMITCWAEFVFRPIGDLPQIGMSGAVSAVMGAYARIFPHKRVHVYLLGLYWYMMDQERQSFSAFWYMFYWLAVNIIYAYATRDHTGGIAYMAHAAGLFIGYIVAPWFRDQNTLLIEQVAIPVPMVKERWSYLKNVKFRSLKNSKTVSPSQIDDNVTF